MGIEGQLKTIPLGARGTFTLEVKPDHLASRFKDATLPPVFSTPVMIMVMENAALNAIKAYLEPGESAVGTRVDIKHLAATPVGMHPNLDDTPLPAAVFNRAGMVVFDTIYHPENTMLIKLFNKSPAPIPAAKTAAQMRGWGSSSSKTRKNAHIASAIVNVSMTSGIKMRVNKKIPMHVAMHSPA